MHEFLKASDSDEGLVDDFLDQYGQVILGSNDANMTEFYSFTGHQMDKMLHRCTWRKKPCSAANFTTTFTDSGMLFMLVAHDKKEK